MRSKVHNVPKYAQEYDWLVARADDKGELWFWGSYETEQRAKAVAKTVKGVVVPYEDD